MSPYIPRARRGEKMLCKGCQQNPGHTFTAASDPVPDKHPADTFKGDFGWENDLAPEGYHPLFSPLPNSIWEKHAQRQALRGRPFMPQASQQEVAANSGDEPKPKSKKQPSKGPRRRRRRGGDQRRLGHIGEEFGEHSHENATPMQHIPDNGIAMHHHLWAHHGIAHEDMPASTVEKQSIHNSAHMLDEPHYSDTGHTHDAKQPKPVMPFVKKGDVIPETGGDAFKDHLMHDHGLPEKHAALGVLKGNAAHGELHHKGANHTHEGFDAPEGAHAPGHEPVEKKPNATVLLNGGTKNEQAHHLIHGHGMSGDDFKNLPGYDNQWSDPEAWAKTIAEHHAAMPHGDDTHTHTDNPHAVQHKTVMTPQEMHQHLQEHHGMTAHGVEQLKSDLISSEYKDLSPAEALTHYHEQHHKNHLPGVINKHDHDAPVKIEGTFPPTNFPHPNGSSSTHLHAHLLKHHYVTEDEIQKAHDASDEPASSVYLGLHHKAHSNGAIKEPHTHTDYESGADDPGNAIHHHAQTVPGDAIGHLVAHHGYSPQEAAQAAQSGDVLAHHNALHDPTNPLALQHGQVTHEHSVHQDEGKPFSGPPATDAYDAKHHLKKPVAEGGHGMSQEDANALHDQIAQELHKKGDYNSNDYVKAFEAHHAALHASGAIPHQHVPTTAEGVITPKKQQEQALDEHLANWHGKKKGQYSGSAQSMHNSLHDENAYGYQGHPGHEHKPNSFGKDPEVTKGLPISNGMEEEPHGPKATPLHHAHPTNMSKAELEAHMSFHGKHDDMLTTLLEHGTMTHDQLAQKHAQQHAMGDHKMPHTHEGPTTKSLMDGDRFFGGKEPEPSYDELPHPHGESDTLSHILSQHPNVGLGDYHEAKHPDTGVKFSQMKNGMEEWHKALHGASGYTHADGLVKAVPDGHTHADPPGPNTDIPIGTHLVTHHGLSKETVAGMTPKEFKQYHEDQHARHEEEDLGHGHVVPGGPVRKPRTVALNPHHLEMRSDPDHPAVTEWYHGTSTEFEGAPMNATELKEHMNRWGNYGANDWNNHAGTHWSSLHQMSKRFGSGRVIHAKLHMKNPIVYNSLNHMAHDAYERLYASGDMRDGGRYHNNHDDDNGYNHCCSDHLLEYAKGEHRNDGKYGLERYRDSLRASGHDGIVVRNQADSPIGHWNAIPLSADQVEITHGNCYHEHNDERDTDVQEFENNSRKLKEGWEHPKHFGDGTEYNGGKPLPTGTDVDNANHEKRKALENTDPPAYVGKGWRTDKDFHGYHAGDGDDDDEDDDDKWCEHCDEYGDHETDDCPNPKQYCKVCDEEVDHDPEEEHPYCDHCGDIADHDSDDHEDEWGEHPDTMKLDGYCPHCDTADKENYGKDECQNCGEDLPKWKTVAAHGKPLKEGEYNTKGITPEGEDVGAKHADSYKKIGTNSELAHHLFHAHHSNPSGKEFEWTDKGQTDWDEAALDLHHKHLHLDPKWAKDSGFEGINHSHKASLGEFKPKEDMTPAEVHAHLLLGHMNTHENGHHGVAGLGEILKMSPEEAVKKHNQLHAADDAIEWGTTDGYGDAKTKIAHHHQQQPVNTKASPAYSPHGAELLQHFKSEHSLHAKAVHDFLKDKPEIAQALHQQMHDSMGPSAEEGGSTYHVHNAAWMEQHHAKKQLKQHLKDFHGDVGSTYGGSNSFEQMQKAHAKEHSELGGYYHSPTPEQIHEHGPGGMDSGGNILDKDKLFQDHDETEHITPDNLAQPGEEGIKEPEKPSAGMKYSPMHELNSMGGLGLEQHLFDEHPELSHLTSTHVPGWDKYVDHPEFQKALAEAKKAHAESHAINQHKHHHDPNYKTSARTLTDLFSEVAL